MASSLSRTIDQWLQVWVFESSWVKIAKKWPAAVVAEFVHLLDNDSKFEGLNPLAIGGKTETKKLF